MTKDAWISLLVKMLLMILTPLAAQLHYNDGASLTAIATDLADLTVLGYGVYSHWGMDKVAVVAKVLLVAFVLPLFLIPAAQAADLAPLAPIKVAAFKPAPTPCTITSCSGWYVGAGLTGDGSNADIIGNGINASVFSAGGILDVHGGYQLWNGSYFAAAEVGIGNEFTRNQALSSLGAQSVVAYELVKLGYGLQGLLNPTTASSTPSQAPAPIGIPASLAGALISPYVTFGAMQRRGISQWVSGAGAEFLIASGWNLDIRYLYAPSMNEVPSTNLVTLGLNRHF